MPKVRSEEIIEGRIRSERIARVLTADGTEEEVYIAPEQTEGDHLLLPVIAEERDRILFELPQESGSGWWRLWISKENVSFDGGPV